MSLGPLWRFSARAQRAAYDIAEQFYRSRLRADFRAPDSLFVQEQQAVDVATELARIDVELERLRWALAFLGAFVGNCNFEDVERLVESLKTDANNIGE